MAEAFFYYNLEINRELFEFYIFYVGVLLFKYLLMIAQVIISRVVYKSPRNPEDGVLMKAKVNHDERVDRNRRAHLNDLENIPFFIIISFLYLLTNPSVVPTQWIIRTYVFTRIFFTIAYTYLKSAIRGPFFTVGLLINVYLCGSVVYYFSGPSK